MPEQQLYVLRVWRDARMEIHATLKGGQNQETQHFANLREVIEFVEHQFESDPKPLLEL
jgi:hypothetical protein